MVEQRLGQLPLIIPFALTTCGPALLILKRPSGEVDEYS